MKKKGLFLLGSMLMAGALAGGTFALWAVTDNADPLNIKVSTGSIISDETKYLTLEWGSSTSIGNVSELAQNTYRKAGVLDLKYSHNETHPDDIYGVLSMDVTATGKLAEKLHVEAYFGNLTADANDCISAANYTAAAEDKIVFDENGDATFKVTTPDTLVTVVAYLDASTDAYDMAQMAALQASVQFDWDLRESDKVHAYTIYASGFASAPSVWAWGATSTMDGEFPGLTMTAVTGKPGLYTAQLLNKYTSMIISGKLTEEGARVQTADLTITEVTAGNKIWFEAGEVVNEKLTGTWRTLPEAGLYLVGNQWDWKTPLEKDATVIPLTYEQGVYKVENVNLLAASLPSEEPENQNGFKVYSLFDHAWYGNGEANVTVSAVGHYDITCNPAGNPAVTAVAHA